jgi:hypothetical protein
MNDNGESTPTRNTPDGSLSQPDIDVPAPSDSLPSTQENNFSSDGSYSVEYVCKKLEKLDLPETANTFRGKEPNLLI